MKTSSILCLVALVCGVNSTFGDWTQYKDGGTHNIDFAIHGDVWVDYQTPGIQTTVNLLTGGNIPSPYKMQSYQDSRININGGSVGYLFAYDNSLVTMTGGSATGYLRAYDNSLVTMTGGSASYLSAYDNSLVTMTDGSVDWNLSAYDNSLVTMTGGSVGYLFAYDNSLVTMTDGSVGYLSAYDNSLVTMTGGSAGRLYANSYGHINWSGGVIQERLTLTKTTILTIEGSSFAIDGTPYDSGEIVSILGGAYEYEPWRILTGTLVDGSNINNGFKIGNNAKIVFVPEPATITLFITGLIAGGLFLLRRK